MRRLLAFPIFFICASACFAATTPVLVQCKNAYFANPPAAVGGTITLDRPTSAGDGLIIFVPFSSGTATTATPTDVQGDTFTQVATYPKTTSSGNFTKFTKYTASNIIGGSVSVTVKLDVQDYLEFGVCEVAQQSRSAMIDKNATGTGTGTTQSSGSQTTTQADLVIGYINANNDVITPSGGFVSISSAATTNSIVEAFTQTTGGSIAANSTTTGGHSWVSDMTAIAPITTAALSTLAVTPANPSAGAGIDTQFTGTGTYADSSTANLSSVCTWTVSNTSNSTITNTGLATGVRASVVTVTCADGAVSGNTTFTITSSTPYTSDDFLGWINTPTNCSGNPLSQNFTAGSQSGTTQTVTVTDGTKFALNEAIKIGGTSTAMDWQFQIKTAQAGMSYITNIAGNVITLTAATSATVAGPVSGTFTDGHVYKQLVNSRWQLCTPEDHWIEAQLVAAADLRNVAAKYSGDNCAAEKYEMLRMVALNFNGTGEDSNEVYDPTKSLTGACPANRNFLSIPQNSDSNSSVYASNNTFGYLDQPIKNLDNGTTSNFPSGCVYHLSGSALLDYQDARWTTFMLQNAINSAGFASVYRSPWAYTMGMFDDTDGVDGVGAGPNFSTVIHPGTQNCNSAFIVMNTSPIQAGNNFELYPVGGANANYLYPDPIAYSKVKAAITPTQCDITHLCSLRDYFSVLYSGSISALNTAEVTGGKYDTFDSDGVIVGWNFASGIAASLGASGNGSAAFALGTGNGATLTFSGTLSTHVDKHSVGIFDNGVLVGADCPFESVNCGGSAGSGIFIGTAMNVGSINYSTGAVTVTFASAPANGHALTIKYIHDGYGYCGVLTHCGLMDQDGVSTSWQGTNPWCLTENPCAGGDQVAANANATFGADLDGYTKLFWGSDMKSAHDAIHTVYPGSLYWGIDCIGAWASPPNKGVLQAANQYVDVLFQNGYDESIDDSTSLSKYDFMTQYFDGPMVQFTVYTSSQSDNGCGGNFPCFTTQASRGTSVYHTQSDFLNTVGHQGNKNQAGWVQWATHNFQSSGFGIFSNNQDNAYDGTEDVVASVACSLAGPLSTSNCGGESGAANFLGANGLTGTFSYKTGNALWFASAPTTFNITVQSSNPSSGCVFTNTTDNGSLTGGTSTYVLNYNSGTSPAVTAPATCGGNSFTSWSGCPSPSALVCNFPSIGSNQVVTANFGILPGCAIGGGSFIGSGSIICDDLTVNYSTPNPLTFTFSTPNTLNLSVAATQPVPSPFSPMQQGPNACPPAPRKNYVMHYTCKEPAQNQASCNCQ